MLSKNVRPCALRIQGPKASLSSTEVQNVRLKLGDLKADMLTSQLNCHIPEQLRGMLSVNSSRRYFN